MNTPIVNQGAFTAVVEIKNGAVQALKNLLNSIGENADLPDCLIEFKQLTTVHFMRLVILDETKSLDDDPRYDLPAYLVLSTNYDRPFVNHLKDVIKVGGKTLRDIYSNCKNFDPVNSDLYAYLCAHQVPCATFYVGTRGRTVTEIEQESALRNAIQVFLDGRKHVENETALDVRRAIQEFVASDPRFAWAQQERRSEFQWRLFFYSTPFVILTLVLLSLLGAGGLGAWLFGPWGLLLPVALVVSLMILAWVWLWNVTVHEKREAAAGPPRAPIMGADLSVLQAREDQIVQNQLSNVVWIKPGWFRLATLRLVLTLINLLGRYWYVRGSLGGIPTIHFARWVILNDNRRLLFFSNFDGSWENYLGDFIDKATSGLTAIWSNCIGCPPSHGLRQGGASDESAFKEWVRYNQLLTQVWYSKYEELSVVNINNNSLIRLGLFGDKSLADTEQWLARI
jgi:hypothetical protein